MADRILVWGAGAIGGSVGAWLQRAGHEVTFVDVVAEHVAAIRNEGLRITGPVALVNAYVISERPCGPLLFNCDVPNDGASTEMAANTRITNGKIKT